MTDTITLGLNYQTLRSNFRGYLEGMGYWAALKALDLGLKYHVGSRKNGEPEFSHQVFQAQSARPFLKHMQDPEGTLCTILLHDIREDHNYPLKLIEQEFNSDIATSVMKMTNVDEWNNDKPNETYYAAMQDDPRASLAKGFDRLHNIMSMVVVFSVEKQDRYIATTRDFIIPMLKQSRKNFPEQGPIYQHLRIHLSSLMMVIEKTRAGLLIRAGLGESV